MNVNNILRKLRTRSAERRKGEAGFTLVELLVVLVILVLLASIVGPRVIGYLGTSRTKTAKIQIESMVTAMELFHVDAGRYPTNAEGLQSLVKPQGNIPGWNGPYLAKGAVPQDPWGRPYVYEAGQNGASFKIKTLGADGKEGGTDENADISN